jgi:hypothetical protein
VLFRSDFQYVIDKANKAEGGVKGSGTKKINLSDRETAILNKTIEKLEAKAVANNGASFDPNETINIQYEKINGKEQKINTYTVDGYSIKYKYNSGKSMTEITTPQGDLLIVSKQYGKTEIAYLGKSESITSKEQALIKGEVVSNMAVNLGSDQGGISDFTANKIKEEDYEVRNVPIEDLLNSDEDLAEYIDNAEEVREFEGEPFNMLPIVTSKGEVVDGYNRIHQAIENGESSIEVYYGVEPASKKTEVENKEQEYKQIKTIRNKLKFVDDNFNGIVAQLILKNKVKRVC